MTRLLSVSASALLAVAASCSPRHWTPPPPPPPPPVVRPQPFSYASPMALVQLGDQAKLYVPRGDSGAPGPIAVVDLATPGRGTRGSGALLGTIDLPVAGEYATFVAGDDRVLVAVSFDFPKAWLIDPTTDKVTKEIALDGLGFSAFGSRDAYVTAAIVDPDRNRAWLAVWNGFAVIDLARGERVPGEEVLAAPSEAPGYDAASGLIYAPFYVCADAHGPAGATPPPCASYNAPGPVLMTSGLNVIRLSDRAVFTLQRPGPSAANPVGLEPDSIAVDTAADLAVVADEDGQVQTALDLSSAVFDEAAKTVQLTSPTAYREFANTVFQSQAADPGSGTFLLATEFTSDLAFATTALLRAGVPPVRGEMPLLPIFPSGVPWLNEGDPHGTAIVRIGGKRYGLQINSDRDWLARIDLDALDATSPVNPTLLSAAEMAPAITYLDLTRAP